MLRSTASKVMWVGRATVFLVGLSVILALVLGVASTAMGANGQTFILGKLNNAATKVTGLVGNVDGAAALRVTNSNAGTNDTALDLRVQTGEAPMRVNSTARVANLNAASAGRADSAASASTATNAQNANTLDNKDSTDFAGGDEAPGFDSFTNDGKWGLRSDIQDAASVSVTAPANGFIILSGDGSFQLNHVQNSSGLSTYAQVSLSETSKSLDFNNLTDAGVSPASPSGASHIPFGITRAFPVTAGEHTFYLTAKFSGPSGSDVLIKDPSLTGFFVKHQF